MGTELAQAINNYIDNRSAHFRVAGSEFFMKISSNSYVSTRLAKFFREKPGNIVSNKEAMGMLLSMQGGHVYLETPDLWIAAPLSMEGEIPRGIPEVGGRIISCRGFLHPQDPLLGEGQISLTGNKYFPFRFNTKHGEYSVSDHAFSKFCERALDSEYFKRTSNVDLDTRRGLVKLLFKEFQGSVPTQRRNVALQTINHGFQKSDYRTNHGWIYVVENGNVLKTCYNKKNPGRRGYVIEKS